MSMKYFEGFDNEDSPVEQPPIDDEQTEATEDSAEPAVSQLDRDVVEFMRAGRILLADAIEDTTPSPDTTFIGNTDKNPFGGYFIELQAMKTLGYGVHFIDNASNRAGRSIRDTHLAIYPDDADRKAVGAISVRGVDAKFNGTPFAVFHDQITSGGVTAASLTAGSYPYKGDPAELLPIEHVKEALETRRLRSAGEDAEEVRQRLLVRGFLTSTIFARIGDLRHPPDYPFIALVKPDRSKMYEQLSAQGERPLNIEELYGMAGNIVAHILDNNPDIQPPASRQQQQPEY